MNGTGSGLRPPARARRRQGQVRVVVVAETAERRYGLVRVLEADGDIVVVGQAADRAAAIRQVGQLRPHVVTIDMAEVAQRETVEQIMGVVPTPILVLAEDSFGMGRVVPDAVRAGALGAIPRPPRWTAAVEADVRRQVRRMRGVTVVHHPRAAMAGYGAVASPPGPSEDGRSSRLVAIGASTGGPAALAAMLKGLAGVQAPVLVVQHIHPDFVEGLVGWMDRVAPLPVRLATDGEIVRSGVVYIGPGNVHLRIGAGMRIQLDAEPRVRHRPSADELFESVARLVGPAAIGVLLTGMGDDGAEGLLAIRQRGGLTIAQDEASSAVFGMPHAAQLLGAAAKVLRLEHIAAAVMAAATSGRT